MVPGVVAGHPLARAAELLVVAETLTAAGQRRLLLVAEVVAAARSEAMRVRM